MLTRIVIVAVVVAVVEIIVLAYVVGPDEQEPEASGPTISEADTANDPAGAGLQLARPAESPARTPRELESHGEAEEPPASTEEATFERRYEGRSKSELESALKALDAEWHDEDVAESYRVESMGHYEVLASGPADEPLGMHGLESSGDRIILYRVVPVGDRQEFRSIELLEQEYPEGYAAWRERTWLRRQIRDLD